MFHVKRQEVDVISTSVNVEVVAGGPLAVPATARRPVSLGLVQAGVAGRYAGKHCWTVCRQTLPSGSRRDARGDRVCLTQRRKAGWPHSQREAAVRVCARVTVDRCLPSGCDVSRETRPPVTRAADTSSTLRHLAQLCLSPCDLPRASGGACAAHADRRPLECETDPVRASPRLPAATRTRLAEREWLWVAPGSPP